MQTYGRLIPQEEEFPSSCPRPTMATVIADGARPSVCRPDFCAMLSCKESLRALPPNPFLFWKMVVFFSCSSNAQQLK